MISDEAVEAAMFAFANAPYLATNQEQMTLALEAAAPHIIQSAKAEAWEEGVRDEYERDYSLGDEITNPYRSQA